MSLSPDQLYRQLVTKLDPFYWVSGDEPLLIKEATDAIRQAALEKGFNDRHSFHSDAGIDWSEVFNITQSFGLFSERQLIEIHLQNKRPDKQGTETLASIFKQDNPDLVVLISSSQLHGKKDKNKAWYKEFLQVGTAVESYPIPVEKLPAWIKNRLAEHQLTATSDALTLLAERNEGNLLAAAQEVEKLALLFPGTEITPQMAQEAVGQSSRYDSFDISDAIVQQDTQRALRIIKGLQEEGVEPPLVLWALRRDCRVLLAFCSGERPQDFIHSSKRAAYQQTARQLGANHIMEAMAQAALADQALKGMLPGDAWQPLTNIILRLCGQPLHRQQERI